MKKQPIYEEVTEIINSTTADFLHSIKDPVAHSLIETFFLRDCAEYFSKVRDVEISLENNAISDDHAASILFTVTRDVLKTGDDLKNELDNIGKTGLIEKVKDIFRKTGIRWGKRSELLSHAFLKPRGYAGDYIIIEKIYENRSQASGFSFCADRAFLDDDYAIAVRSRMEKMKEALLEYTRENASETVHIVNMACGSCREIRLLLEDTAFPVENNITFTLIDQDEEALDYSREKIDKLLYGNIYVEYVQQSIYHYIENPENHYKELEGADLIYSIGLADYLPDEALKKFVSFSYSRLKTGGTLVIAHKDSINYNPLSADWWCNWTFHLRNEEEVVSLINNSGIKDFHLSVEREDTTNIILFIKIKKN